VEEAGFAATRWHVLVDYANSPGGSSEVFRCYLARGLSPVPGGRTLTGEAEEAHLPRAWVDLDVARDLVLAGRLTNPTAVAGILAAWASRAGGWPRCGRPSPWRCASGSAVDAAREPDSVGGAPALSQRRGVARRDAWSG
jgi:ADP-ribose pyrophosphatase